MRCIITYTMTVIRLLFWSLISIEHASGHLNSCIVFANEDLFAQLICKNHLASWRQSMMAVGKKWFGFWRFKKCWRVFAWQRTNTRHLDQNWQSLACKAQRSDHWAKNANLTCQGANDCDYKVLIAKKNSQPEKHVESQCGCSPTLVLSPTMKIWLGNSNELCLQRLNLSSTRNSALHHDLALLQQAMNAVGDCSPQKWKHENSGVIALATFYCRWLGNHPFHLC